MVCVHGLALRAVALGWAWTLLGCRTRSGSKSRVREMPGVKRAAHEAYRLPTRSEGITLCWADLADGFEFEFGTLIIMCK